MSKLRNLYARLLVWLLRPALDTWRHEQEILPARELENLFALTRRGR